MTATVAGIHLGLDTHANRPAANTAPDGSLYSCTTHGLIYKSNFAGNSWATWASLAGTGLTDPMTTRGDIIVRDAANATARLAVGAAGRVFMSDGTDPSWTALAKASYKRTTGDYTTTSNTFADVDGTNLSFAVTTGARRILVAVSCTLAHSSGTDYVGLDIDIDGARQGGTFGLLFLDVAAANEPFNGSFSFISEPLTAGAHTVKLQWRRSAAGTVTMYGAGNAYSKMSVAELA